MSEFENKSIENHKVECREKKNVEKNKMFKTSGTISKGVTYIIVIPEEEE